MTGDKNFSSSAGVRMRKIRRVTVEIEHREVTLTSGRSPMVWSPDAARPDACPVCGSPRILSLVEALTEPGFIQELLDFSSSADRVHLGRSLGGEYWICGESLHSQ
jgi:hypothetical protein